MAQAGDRTKQRKAPDTAIWEGLGCWGGDWCWNRGWHGNQRRQHQLQIVNVVILSHPQIQKCSQLRLESAMKSIDQIG